MRYRAESGNELDGGFLRITLGDTVFLYQTAYSYTTSPYDKLLGYCTDLAWNPVQM